VDSRITHDDLMRYLDGESSPQERESIDRQVSSSTELQREVAVFRAMKADLQDLSFVPAGNGGSVWDQVNRKLARPLGWVFLIVGATVWVLYGLYLFLTSAAEMIEKLATSAIGIGVLLLLTTVIWERYQEWLTDPYRDVYR
jgi:hypothetical protein